MSIGVFEWVFHMGNISCQHSSPLLFFYPLLVSIHRHGEPNRPTWSHIIKQVEGKLIPSESLVFHTFQLKAITHSGLLLLRGLCQLLITPYPSSTQQHYPFPGFQLSPVASTHQSQYRFFPAFVFFFFPLKQVIVCFVLFACAKLAQIYFPHSVTLNSSLLHPQLLFLRLLIHVNERCRIMYIHS